VRVAKPINNSDPKRRVVQRNDLGIEFSPKKHRTWDAAGQYLHFDINASETVSKVVKFRLLRNSPVMFEEKCAMTAENIELHICEPAAKERLMRILTGGVLKIPLLLHYSARPMCGNFRAEVARE
jgi:hypothetical protein